MVTHKRDRKKTIKNLFFISFNDYDEFIQRTQANSWRLTTTETKITEKQNEEERRVGVRLFSFSGLIFDDRN